MASADAAQANEKKRVKVYELRNNDWFDRGTGFCTGQVINDESKIHVESEDEPERLLLETRISKDDGYQKQQDTLIVWTEPGGTDMALSFQEADGCAAIWEFVARVQQHLAALAGPDDPLSDNDMENFPQPVMLPAPELGTLADIEHTMRIASSTPQGRDSLSKFLIADDFIKKLVGLVEVAEDLEALQELHRLSNIMKMLILLNDTQIIELVVSNDLVLGVVGALEYDQDFPNHKANHRQYLRDESRFKEVVPIEDPAISKKIHSTWRLQYLKDVVLARILDDPTFSVLNSLIFFNQVDIVSHLQGNTPFLKDLFGIIDSPEADTKKRKDAICFIQQCCAIAKNLQAPARATLYSNFVQNGLLNVITYALAEREQSIRVAGTDILVAMIDHDPSMVRAYISGAIKEDKKPLTETLIELMLVEADLGVKAQAADAIKVLLDPQQSPPPQTNPEFLSKLRGAIPPNPQTETFIRTFYNDAAKKLFQPLKDLETKQSVKDLTFHEISLFTHLVEILMFFVRSHYVRCRFFIRHEGIAARVGQLLACPQKHMKLAALKFFRACLGLQDEFYYEELVRYDVFEPILNIVYETMPRDNLLNSACLELFEFIKRETIKPIIVHVVEKYRQRLQDITYVDLFRHLVVRYDQIQGFKPETDGALFPDEDGTPARARANGHQRWQGMKDMDAAEEEYFNTSDDEDELAAAATPILPSMANGSSPLLKLSVDYPDDDDEIPEARMQTIYKKTLPARDAAKDRAGRHASPPTARAIAPGPPTPPERLSEKRRREEDEEDELAKLALSQSKRRSSSLSSAGSAASNGGHLIRRKKSFSSKDGGKKIAFTLAVKTAIETEQRGGDGG